MTAVGLTTWVSLLATGDYSLVTAYFRYAAPLFSVGFCAVEVLLCFRVWSRLDAQDGMKTAWFWLLMASLTHLTGRTLGLPTQPLPASEAGRILAGPVQMSLLLAGLLNVLIHCRRVGLLRRLEWSDYALLAVVFGLMLRTLSVIAGASGTDSFATAALWTSDPLLLLLLASAVLVRRALAPLGRGLLANCWWSFVAAIVLTSLGSASSWCMDCSTTPVWTSLGWYVWVAVDCAFALGPAFQLAALEHVRSRARVYEMFADHAFWRVP